MVEWEYQYAVLRGPISICKGLCLHSGFGELGGSIVTYGVNEKFGITMCYFNRIQENLTYLTLLLTYV